MTTLTTFWDVLFESGSTKKSIPFESLRESASITHAIEQAAGVDRTAVWNALSDSLDERARTLLSQPVETYIFQAFAAYHELLQYTDARRYPAESEVLHSYAEVPLKVAIEPRLELRVDGRTIASLPLEAALDLVVKGVVLTITGGQIRAFRVGQIDARGVLRVAGTAVHRTPEAKVFKGFEKVLDRGIPIAPWKGPVSPEVVTLRD